MFIRKSRWNYLTDIDDIWYTDRDELTGAIALSARVFIHSLSQGNAGEVTGTSQYNIKDIVGLFIHGTEILTVVWFVSIKSAGLILKQITSSLILKVICNYTTL